MMLHAALPILLAVGAPGFRSSKSCAPCHASIYEQQSTSRHALALRPFAGSALEKALSSHALGEKGGCKYEYDSASVTLTNGDEKVRAALEWAFGAGEWGTTAVGRSDGRYYEHRISFYAVPGRPGITPGHAPAGCGLGVMQSAADAFRCFSCHATGVERDASGGPDISSMEIGVRCERCHGPGEKHIEAAEAKRPQPEIRKAIFNAGKLPAKALVEVCGGCHRLPRPGAFVDKPELEEPISVRFQPVGLMASRCFRESKKLSCVTCHDPHADAVRDAAFYTDKCAGCHASAPAARSKCRRAARENCLPCHLRKASPLPHFTFTDHRIRVY